MGGFSRAIQQCIYGSGLSSGVLGNIEDNSAGGPTFQSPYVRIAITFNFLGTQRAFLLAAVHVEKAPWKNAWLVYTFDERRRADGVQNLARDKNDGHESKEVGGRRPTL